MTNDKYYAKLVETSFDIGERRSSQLQTHPRLLELYGYTGLRTKHFLNSLLSNGKLNYVELGVYRAASLINALYNNPEITANFSLKILSLSEVTWLNQRQTAANGISHGTYISRTYVVPIFIIFHCYLYHSS